MRKLIGALSLIALLLGSTGASAAPDTTPRLWLAGTGPLCELPEPNPCPTVARAANGDTIEIAGAGTFTKHSKSVSGGGTFVHRDPHGDVIGAGTFTATQLVSFHSYGTDEFDGLVIEGGLLLIRVSLFVNDAEVATGILQIDCLVGDPPTGAIEGVRLAVQGGGPNFNKEVSGLTVFLPL